MSEAVRRVARIMMARLAPESVDSSSSPASAQSASALLGWSTRLMSRSRSVSRLGVESEEPSSSVMATSEQALQTRKSIQLYYFYISTKYIYLFFLNCDVCS